MQSPDANRAAGRLPLELVTHGDLAGSDRAGHDGPVPGDGERAVDRHPEETGVGRRFDRGAGRLERRLSSGKPAPVTAEVRTIAAPSRNVPRTSPRISSSTRSSQDGSTRSHLVRATTPEDRPSKVEDLHVLACLRHDRVVGRDDQHGQVETRGAREHVADEPLVAGHVDQGDLIIAQLERREAQVDRDAALLFGRQAIGVDAGQGADQGGLAVVDVAGGAED